MSAKLYRWSGKDVACSRVRRSGDDDEPTFVQKQTCDVDRQSA